MDAETSVRRLMAVVDLLRRLPPWRFNFETWVGRGWGGAADLSCGTTACALGWATTVPELATAGLCLKQADNGQGYVDLALGDQRAETGFTDVPLLAAMAVFGIDMTEAQYLFVAEYDSPIDDLEPSPPETAAAVEVADHIERFVKAKWPALPPRAPVESEEGGCD